MTDTNQASEVLQGDCLELMKDIPDGSVDQNKLYYKIKEDINARI